MEDNVKATQETKEQKEDKQIAAAANDQELGKAEKTWASRYANLRKFLFSMSAFSFAENLRRLA